jgi:spermine oxidase
MRPNASEHLDVDTKIQLNKEVTNIQWDPSVKNGKVIVTCADDSKFEADYVIFTGSLGVLKDRHDKLFTPNLPTEKIDTIKNMGFGTLDKIFLEFEEPFWNKFANGTFRYQFFLWKQSDIDEIINTDMAWLLDIPGFDSVDSFPNLLECFIVSQGGDMSELMSDEKVISDVIWLMEKFFGEKIPTPTRMFRSKWHTNRNFLGSYSYFSVLAEKENSHPDILREPLKDSDNIPKILFAGEATHNQFSGYTHGGMESGWIAAETLVEALK